MRAKALTIPTAMTALLLSWQTPAALSQPVNQGAPSGISMTVYPVERGNDGLQYLITPSGKRINVPGLGIAQNATQVSVYRDQNNNFWYTNMTGQPTAVTPQQLEWASAQINGQQQMPTQPAPYYNSNPAYAGGFNGVPYGTPMTMEAPGQYAYMAPGGNKQYVSPAPQASPQFNQWQQQTPWNPQMAAPTAAAPQQQAPQSGGSGQQQPSDPRGTSRLRDNRAQRLDTRSKNQSTNSANDQSSANSSMQSGDPLSAGFRARRSGREERRSKREDRRADRLGQ